MNWKGYIRNKKKIAMERKTWNEGRNQNKKHRNKKENKYQNRKEIKIVLYSIIALFVRK